jgi:hypothetical protein
MRWILLIAAVVIAAPASAHWQYTRWGMTPAQVQAANPAVQLGEDRGASARDSQVLASARYSASGLTFNARFGFDANGRLNKVSLDLLDRSGCVELNGSLRSVYGEPLPGERMSFAYLARWRDEAGGNMVSLLAIGGLSSADTCSLDYRPIRSRSETGL